MHYAWRRKYMRGIHVNFTIFSFPTNISHSLACLLFRKIHSVSVYLTDILTRNNKIKCILKPQNSHLSSLAWPKNEMHTHINLDIQTNCLFIRKLKHQWCVIFPFFTDLYQTFGTLHAAVIVPHVDFLSHFNSYIGTLTLHPYM